MRILGVDPGLRVTGYGLIEVSSKPGTLPKINLLEAGVVRTHEREGIAERLRKVYDSLSDVVREFKPDVLAIEKLYTHTKHPATSILMGHARGVVCLLAGVRNIKLVNIASTHVKKSLTGHGHAGKRQIQRMVQRRLGLKDLPEPPDVADALAVAIACASQQRGAKG